MPCFKFPCAIHGKHWSVCRKGSRVPNLRMTIAVCMFATAFTARTHHIRGVECGVLARAGATVGSHGAFWQLPCVQHCNRPARQSTLPCAGLEGETCKAEEHRSEVPARIESRFMCGKEGKTGKYSGGQNCQGRSESAFWGGGEQDYNV